MSTANSNNPAPPTDETEWYQPTLADDGSTYSFWALDETEPWSDVPRFVDAPTQSRQEWLTNIVRLVAVASSIASLDTADYIGVAKRRNTPADDQYASELAKAYHSAHVLSQQLSLELLAGPSEGSVAGAFHLDDSGVQLLIRSSVLSLMRNLFQLADLEGTAFTFGNAAEKRYDEGLQSSDAVMDAAVKVLTASDESLLYPLTPGIDADQLLKELFKSKEGEDE